MDNTFIEINKIAWDRIWIRFFINVASDGCKLWLADKDGNPLFLLKKGEEEKEYKLNITNPGGGKMLSTGVFRLVLLNKEGNVKALQYCGKMEIKKLNRQFVYFHSERAYRVQFSSRDGIRIRTSDVELDIGMKRKLLSRIRRTRHDTAKLILRTIYNVEYFLFHRKGGRDVHSLSDPRILLMSDQSEEMGSNMAALEKALIRNGYHPRELLRAITTKHYSILHWIISLNKIAEADFLFLDDHSQTTDWLTIRGAIITQLWHAGAGFKSTGYSRFGMPASPAPKSGHRQYTYGIAGSKKIRHFFSEVWGIDDEKVLPTGMPRLDEFLDENYRREKTAELLQRYSELCKPGISIFLLAPTYRGENKRKAYYPYDKLDMSRLYRLCEEKNAVMLFKMHPFVTEPVPIAEEYKDRLLDVSDYPNINDLFYITDLLITDYSSNIYEFSLMKKPMLFYAFDIDEYSKDRGFHRDYRGNVPGRIAEDFDSMCRAIETDDYEFERVSQYVENNFEYNDTHACDRIIDWIIKGNYDGN